MGSDVCVSKVVDGWLVLDVSEGDVGCHLLNYDVRTPYGTLTVDDLELHEGVSSGVASLYFQEVVVSAFVESGVVDRSKADAVKMFINLYNKLKRAEQVIELWKEHGTAGGLFRNELEFTPEYWNRDVLPHLMGAGVFSNSAVLGLDLGLMERASGFSRGIGYQLGEEFHEVFTQLGGATKIGGGGGCADRKAYLQTDTCSFPKILQESAREAVAMYTGIVTFLKQWREVECEGRGCPKEDEFKIFRLIDVRDSCRGRAAP